MAVVVKCIFIQFHFINSEENEEFLPEKPKEEVKPEVKNEKDFEKMEPNEEEKKTESKPIPVSEPPNIPPIHRSSLFSDMLTVPRSELMNIRPFIEEPIHRRESIFEHHLARRLMRGHEFGTRLPTYLRESGNPLFARSSDPIRDKFKKLHEGLLSSDETILSQAAADLATELLMTQENSISSYMLEQFIDPLITCLKSSRPPVVIGISNIFSDNYYSKYRNLPRKYG